MKTITSFITIIILGLGLTGFGQSVGAQGESGEDILPVKKSDVGKGIKPQIELKKTKPPKIPYKEMKGMMEGTKIVTSCPTTGEPTSPSTLTIVTKTKLNGGQVSYYHFENDQFYIGTAYGKPLNNNITTTSPVSGAISIFPAVVAALASPKGLSQYLDWINFDVEFIAPPGQCPVNVQLRYQILEDWTTRHPVREKKLEATQENPLTETAVLCGYTTDLSINDILDYIGPEIGNYLTMDIDICGASGFFIWKNWARLKLESNQQQYMESESSFKHLDDVPWKGFFPPSY